MVLVLLGERLRNGYLEACGATRRHRQDDVLRGSREAGFAIAYLFVHPGIVKRSFRGAMVLIAFYMITVPLAAVAHSGLRPWLLAVDVPNGVPHVEATGAIGVVIALLAALVVLVGSWLTVLDSVGETVPGRRSRRS